MASYNASLDPHAQPWRCKSKKKRMHKDLCTPTLVDLPGAGQQERPFRFYHECGAFNIKRVLSGCDFSAAPHHKDKGNQNSIGGVGYIGRGGSPSVRQDDFQQLQRCPFHRHKFFDS
ncbi:MAG: hypothetical protein ACI3V5_03680 [Faecousia sp.]